ncbi:USH1C-binding protein 1 [Deltaproteobacteria bacterium Smac51]|nr:USH1C-binding protein 1 [Deltaproteobacteria bacterium Smac51]
MDPTSSSTVSFNPEALASGNMSVQMQFAILQMTLAEANKQSALDYMDQITAAQEESNMVADMISQCRVLQDQAKNETKDSAKTDAGGDGKKDGYTAMPPEIQTFMDDHGLAYDTSSSDNMHDEDEWDVAITSLQNYQETLGTDTQTLMVYVQDFMGQYNSYLSGANSAIQESNQILRSLATGQ